MQFTCPVTKLAHRGKAEGHDIVCEDCGAALASRKSCPPENIGRLFGTVGLGGALEGSVISSNYCVVANGRCSRHEPQGDVYEEGLPHP
jgi:hypothetical protein